jgi:uncharacterized RDD family membrane protein YckC
MSTRYPDDQDLDSSATTASSESMPSVYVLADWTKRVCAGVVDLAVFLLILSVGSVIGGEGSGFARLTTAIALVFWLWNLWMEGVDGRSMGKRVVGLKLVSVGAAGVVGPRTSLLRGILHGVLDVLPVVGVFWPLWDEKRQTFADKVCGTVVIQSEVTEHH